jgi:hypothetical protein
MAPKSFSMKKKGKEDLVSGYSMLKSPSVSSGSVSDLSDLDEDEPKGERPFLSPTRLMRPSPLTKCEGTMSYGLF